MITKTPEPPYYAVIFTSLRTEGDNGYTVMAELMEELARQQPGYLGIESARSGIGITVSYWKSEEAIRQWKDNVQHAVARRRGKEAWYSYFHIRICKVERDYAWNL